MPPCGYATPVRVLVDSGFVAASSSPVPTGSPSEGEEGLQLGAISPDARGVPQAYLPPLCSWVPLLTMPLGILCSSVGLGRPLLCWR